MTDEIELDQEDERPEDNEDVAGFDDLLKYLNESRGFDFAGYKRTGLARRLLKRVRTLGLATFDEYVDYLEVHPDEFDHLFNSVLINATSFFRDPSAWELLAKQVVPQIIEAKKNASAIRVWSAGCATGQEAYTVAMVFAQALGLEAFARKVKIYATDMDDDALAQARQATYTQKELAGVPPDVMATFFERSGSKYTFLKEARRSVIFGRHNLLHDAPISRIDLLLCRNTLMYFNSDAQARILSSIHFALSESGVLFLGKAEMLLTNSTLFAPLDLKRRMFTKVTHSYPRERIMLNGLAKRADEVFTVSEDARLREAVFEVSPIAQLGLNARGVITLQNEQARRLFDLDHEDVGRTLAETGLTRKIEPLRSLIDQAGLERRPSRLVGCELKRGPDDSLYLDIVASPLFDEHGSTRGIHISFVDGTSARRMQHELQQATQDLEGAYEELQATSEALETTNEELQSTVEELETTNEELQSTNEELETTNEELQSTNEELQGMNETLRARTGELGRINLHFESILASLESAVVVLDPELLVQVWSSRAAELWGLRAEEVQGKHFLGLDIGLPVEKLRGQIRTCLSGEAEYQEMSIAATNRRGKAIQCAVKISRLTQSGQSHGVILLMDQKDSRETEHNHGAATNE
jgi:two-component system CheB/CheR fusion protein